jgi:hypothetical protein
VDELKQLLAAHGPEDRERHCCDDVRRTFGEQVHNLYREMANLRNKIEAICAVSATTTEGTAPANINEHPEVQAMIAARSASTEEGPELRAAHDGKRAPSDGTEAQTSREEMPILQRPTAASPRKAESESAEGLSA